jgi:hypothetical protein
MKRPFLWLAICMLPLIVYTQTPIESKLQAILNDLKTADDSGFSILPPETQLAGYEKSGTELTVKLDVPIYFLDRKLDAVMAEEVIEHFATPMSEFGFYTVFVKAQNEFGMYFHLSEFLNEKFSAYETVIPNTDPSPARQGRKGVDTYSNVQPKGQLSGSTVWLSAGHGWLYDNRRSSYKTQRSNFFGLVEDFSNIETVNYHLLKYLYNAGANVWTVRERDMNEYEVIVDNDDKNGAYRETGAWESSKTPGYRSRSYRYSISKKEENAAAIFTPDIPKSGMYWVSVYYVAGLNRTVDARYKIFHAGGESRISINQEVHGGTWIYLGQFYFEKGKQGKVILTNESTETGQVVVADAVRFGGGIGNAPDCEFTKTSREPRFEEAAKYYAVFQGFPECLNDVSIRPAYAEWELEKGTREERNNAVYISWHSNADGGSGTESYIHSHKKTAGSKVLQSLVHDQLIKDIKTGYDKNWNDRGQKAADFGELRGLRNMPGVLLEVGFHDHSKDAAALSEPEFRDLTARAVYKGIARYFAKRNGKTPVFLPEPPTHLLVVNRTDGDIELSWKAPQSGGIYGDAATSYKVYVSLNGKGFDNGTVTSTNRFRFENPGEGTVYYFKVSALNNGGESFPTAVVAARTPSRGLVDVPFLIVDGFDRLDKDLAVIVDEPFPKYAPLGKTRRLFIEQMNNFDYAILHAQSLAAIGKAFDGATNEAIIDGHLQLSNYTFVNWFLGRESTKDATLDQTEQALLKKYLDNGGNLIISGSELAFDLVSKNKGKDFYRNYLKADFKSDDAGTNGFASFANQHFGRFTGKLSSSEYGAYPLKSPDVIAPLNGSQSILEYQIGQTAAVGYKNEYGLINFGFPLETIGDEQTRNLIFQKSFEFLSPNDTPPDSKNKIAEIPKAINDRLVIGMSHVAEGRASLSIYTSVGKEVYSESWRHDGRSDKVISSFDLPPGALNYALEINGLQQSGWVVKE